jgi:competence protein ComGC
MKNFYTQIRNTQAFGLVEALVALAIVGTGMILITSLSIRTIKQARKNELQDVAIQSAVEAMDFLKDPGEIQADLLSFSGATITDANGYYYALDFSEAPKIKAKAAAYLNSDVNEINDCSTTHFTMYGVTSLEPDYIICQQILVRSEQASSERFDVKVIVVWETVGGEYDKRVIEGFRIGAFDALTMSGPVL